MRKHRIIASGLVVGSFILAGCGASAPPSLASLHASASVSAQTTASDVPPPTTVTPSSGPAGASAGSPSATMITLDMVSVQQGWAMDTQGHVLQTTDGGRQWRNVASRGLTQALQHAAQAGGFTLSPEPGGNLVGSDASVAFPNAQTAWMTIRVPNRNTLQVWHTTDGGHHWTMATIHHAVSGGLAGSLLAAIGNRDAWMVAATMGLLGHVDIQIWRTSRAHPIWQVVSRGTAPNTSGLAFATGSLGVLTEGSNLGYEPNNAALAVTVNGGQAWSQLGEPTSPVQPALPVLPGHWFTTVLAPAIVPHTQDLVAPVLMQTPFPAKTAPLKTWWRLDESRDWGQTWTVLPTTPHTVLPKPPNLLFQAWATPARGWLVLGTHLYRTTDGGQQWAASSLPAGTVVTLDRVSGTAGFVLIQQGAHTVIYRTADGGVLWTRVS